MRGKETAQGSGARGAPPPLRVSINVTKSGRVEAQVWTSRSRSRSSYAEMG